MCSVNRKILISLVGVEKKNLSGRAAETSEESSIRDLPNTGAHKNPVAILKYISCTVH